MTRNVTRRAYDSPLRREAANATRQSIIDAARRVFLEKGYSAATMSAIAQAAGISLDTVYATVGKKPGLFRLLVETAISGSNEAVPAHRRDYVRAIRAETDAAQKLRILYGGSVKPDNIEGLMNEAELDGALVGGASLDPESFLKIVKAA